MLSKPTSPTPSSPHLELVSTTECSDGSMLFRFGEVTEDEVEESTFVLGGLATGSTQNSNVVRVLDGEHERQVIVKEIEREARRESATELADNVKNIDSIVCANDNGANESKSTVVIDMISCEAEPNDLLLDDIQEIEVPVFEEVPIESIGSSISEAAHVSHINEPGSSSFGFVNDMGKGVRMLENSREDNKQEMSGPVNPSLPGKEIHIEDGISEEVLQVRSEVETMGSSTVSEHSSVLEVGNSLASEESGKKNASFEVNCLPKIAENHTTEAVMGSKCDEGNDRGNVIETKGNVIGTLSSPVLDEGTSHYTKEEPSDTVGNESSIKVNDSATNVALEGGNTVNNARNSDVIEVSGHGAVALESTVAASNGEEISATGYFLSSGVSLLPHPSKVGRMLILLLGKTGWEWQMELVNGH